jgi:hypothetical protein
LHRRETTLFYKENRITSDYAVAGDGMFAASLRVLYEKKE